MAPGISIPCHLPPDSPALAFLRHYPREHAQAVAHCALLYGVRCLEVVGDGATLSLEQLAELSGFEPHAAEEEAETEAAAPVDRRAGRAAASAAIRGAASAWDDESDAVAAGLRKRSRRSRMTCQARRSS